MSYMACNKAGDDEDESQNAEGGSPSQMECRRPRFHVNQKPRNDQISLKRIEILYQAYCTLIL